MSFQTTINRKQAAGVPGEFRDTAVKRVAPFAIGKDCVIGRPAYLLATGTGVGKATDTFASGTAAKYLGVFVNPKEYVNYDGTLQPTLLMKVSTGQAAQIASLGHVWVTTTGAVTKGATAYYNNGWTATAPTAGNDTDGSALGVFIDSAATAGEVVGVSVNVTL